MGAMIPHISNDTLPPRYPYYSSLHEQKALPVNALSQQRQARIVPYKETFSAFCTRYFIEEKVDLTMSKGSLMGLVLGLMLLGILFFLSGFLAAVHLYTPGASLTSLPTEVHNPLASPYHLPTQPTYATSSPSHMPTTSKHTPTTQQSAVVVPSSRQPSEYITNPPYTTDTYKLETSPSSY